MVRSVTAHARDITPPTNFNAKDAALAEHAAGHFEAMCRTCHGAPGKKPDPWQLYPPAPDLADALRVTRWSDAEVFWIIKFGIKDTGMSAFGASHEDEDLWALTAFVRQLDTITPEKYYAISEHAMKDGGHGHAEHGNEKSPTPEPAAKAAPPHQH
jgi:mono/diheme cytochrome c family protein